MPSLSGTYRPQRFTDVTDQEPIKETLRREVATNKIGHAYLFAGPRGVGKTTTARIFAKALNCLEPKDGEPCNACVSCLDVNAGKSLDVIEMDAASNTGVDNVREAIIEHVRFVPQRSHKIYILDEAHMLSPSAWNAMLKTIEEPPAYAVFLFLTTELHKVPATIASRCQRFDFKRISDDALLDRITLIAEKEGISLDSAVARTIVTKSDGCLRDAENLLGQLLVLGEKRITVDVANLVLPVSRLPVAADVLASWSRRELGPALLRIEELEAQGIPLLPLFDDLLQAVRYVLLASDSVEWRQRLAKGDEGERATATLVTAFEPGELSDLALMLMERRRDAKQGADVRFCLELAATAACLSLLPHAHSVESDVLQNDEPPKQPPASPLPNSRTSPPAPTKTPQVDVEPGMSFTLGQVQAKWASFLRLMDEKSKSLTFVLKITQPDRVDGICIVLRFQYPFHREKILNDTKAKHLIEDTLAQALGVNKVQIDGIVAQESEDAKEQRSRDMVSNIMKAFGGQLVEGTS